MRSLQFVLFISIFYMIKSRRQRAGHSMPGKQIHTTFWSKYLKGKYHLRDLHIDWKIS